MKALLFFTSCMLAVMTGSQDQTESRVRPVFRGCGKLLDPREQDQCTTEALDAFWAEYACYSGALFPAKDSVCLAHVQATRGGDVRMDPKFKTEGGSPLDSLVESLVMRLGGRLHLDDPEKELPELTSWHPLQLTIPFRAVAANDPRLEARDDLDYGFFDVETLPIQPGCRLESSPSTCTEGIVISTLQNYMAAHRSEFDANGTSYVSFIINRQGEVERITTVRSVSEVVDRLAREACATLPPFEPAMQGGVPVSVRLNLPVHAK